MAWLHGAPQPPKLFNRLYPLIIVLFESWPTLLLEGWKFNQCLTISKSLILIKLLLLSQVNSCLNVKSKNSILPISTIACHFNREVANHGYNLRNRSTGSSVVPVELLSTYARRSIQHRATKLWAEIPMDVRNLGFFGAFKRQYKKHLLNSP